MTLNSDPEHIHRFLKSPSVGPIFAITSMVTFQAGMAFSVPLLVAVGPSVGAWLRMVAAAFALYALVRPNLFLYSLKSLRLAALSGMATCGMAFFFAEAIIRIPLGMATAIEFLGPLAVALGSSRARRGVGWVVLAAVGVASLTLEPSAPPRNIAGIAFALGAAGSWAGYIILTKRVSDAFVGLEGLAVSLAVCAIVGTPVAFWQWKSETAVGIVAASLGLGLIIPGLPYSLEMLALRKMTPQTFGMLMSLDPAIAAVLGWMILGQALDMQKVSGIAFVIVASIGTIRGRARAVSAPLKGEPTYRPHSDQTP